MTAAAEEPPPSPPAGASPAPPSDDDGAPPPPYCALPPARHRLVLGLVIAAGLLGPLAGSAYLPALPVLEREFGLGATAVNATVSAFMLTFAFAPLFWASFADVCGRRPLYIISLAVFIVANVLVAALPSNFGALVFLRVLQAFGSAAVVSMGAGTVTDITEPERRASVMSLFLLGPQCGPIMGPVLGAALAGRASWRWIFGFLAIIGVILWLVIILMLPETLRYRVGNGKIHSMHGSWLVTPPALSSPLAPEAERGPKPPKPSLMGYWQLLSRPAIAIVTVSTALLYSSYFAMAVHLPHVLEDVYHWQTAAVGAGFLAIGLALIVGSVVGGCVNDWRRARLVRASGGADAAPESRLADQIWGVVLFVVGIVLFGWFVDRAVHPAAVLVSTAMTMHKQAGFGMSWVFISTAAFLTESVPRQAAGAFAVGNMFRNPGAAIAVVLLPPLLSRIGVGWFFTGLGLLDLMAVGSATMMLRICGPRWRSTAEQGSKA